MQYTAHYDSPLGGILLAADAAGLTGLWFDGQKFFAAGLSADCRPGETPALTAARLWLDTYFSGREPDFLPPLHPLGTPFQREVWSLLREIPYGETVTYGALARTLSSRRGSETSARAVGSAVGHNGISILIPCHRVLGSGGALTGYAGGVDKKKALLVMEGAVARQRSPLGPL